MSNRINPLLLLIFLAISILFSCKKDCPECLASEITVDVQMIKRTGTCKDLGFNFDVTAGVGLNYQFDNQCGENCEGRQIAFHQRRIVKNANGIKEDDLKGTMVVQCGNLGEIKIALYNKIDDPGELIFELGDTVVYELFDIGLCEGSGFANCGEETLLDVPNFIFEYVFVPEDFDCL